MGSFAGVSVNAQELQEVVNLAEQKKVLAEQNRLYQLSQSLNNYATEIQKSTFPDGEYYVTSDFVSEQVKFQGDAYNPFQNHKLKKPTVKAFKKGDLVKVVTVPKDMSMMNMVSAINTDLGDFYADKTKLSKTKPNEVFVSENYEEAKTRNDNKIKIIIIGAFVLGYLLSNK